MRRCVAVIAVAQACVRRFAAEQSSPLTAQRDGRGTCTVNGVDCASGRLGRHTFG
jgi:hypothetical protein